MVSLFFEELGGCASEEPRIIVGNLSDHTGMAYLRELREPDPLPL